LITSPIPLPNNTPRKRDVAHALQNVRYWE